MVEGPEFGGRGGTGQTVYCPIGTVLSGVHGVFTRNRQIASLALTCRTLASGQPAGVLFFGNPAYRPSERGAIGQYLYEWSQYGKSFTEKAEIKNDCPVGELATGFTVNFGIHVNAFGLTCDRIAYPAPPKVAAPPPAPPRPSGPPVAHPFAFQGGWQTATDQNGHFTLILQIPNQGLDPLLYDTPVTGQFINTDGASQYNGTLQGVIPRATRTLHYNYSQPGIEAGGQGQFTLSNDGNSITGTGKVGDVTFTWNGTRAR